MYVHPMLTRSTFFLSTLAALTLISADAGAGGLSIGFSKHGKHSSVGVQIGFPACSPRPAPPQYGGHWETVVERVWVPGSCERVWIAPVHETRYDSCGRAYQVCVRAGFWDTIQHPGHYEDHSRQVWRAAGWSRHWN